MPHNDILVLMIDRSRCRDLAVARQLEWLVTNGCGGFATGTLPGLLTRRYPGLLVAAPKSPSRRYVLLAKLEPTIHVKGKFYELSTNEYPAALHPQGFRLLESFTDDPCPIWRWRAGDALIAQSIKMIPG